MERDVILYNQNRIKVFKDSTIIGPSGGILAHRYTGKYKAIQLKGEFSGFMNIYVHRLVYYWFTYDDRIFTTHSVHHVDHDKMNNSFDNLTALETRLHMQFHSNGNLRNAKITPEQVLDIIVEYERGGISQQALGAKYGISQTAVYEILSGKKWGYLTGR